MVKENQQVYMSVEHDVMTIRIDNPETKNGLDWEGIHQLCDCYEAMAREPGLRVAVITGNDEYFYTGGRVDATIPGEKERYADAIARFSDLSDRCGTPMIAAVSGHCLKAGMGMLASCDFAVAREGVEFGFPEVRMGGVPMMVLVDTIGLMPPKRELEAYLTSWNFSAQEAYQMGLVNRVVPKEAFAATVEKFVRVYLDTPPDLVEMTRRAYKAMRALPDKKSRAEFAMQMLRSEVLTTMSAGKTEYNV